MLKFLKKIFGDDNDKEIQRMMEHVEKINQLESDMQAMSDASLAAKTVEFRQRLEDGEELIRCCMKRLL